MARLRIAGSGLSDLIVVGIGASAGGLEACTRLLAGMPARSGCALVMVQHLDPRHENLSIDLLRDRTAMVVVQAAHGMPLAADHLYVIPPGMDMTVSAEALRLSPSVGSPGPRTTFDTLLASIAEHHGPRGACVVLSGTGADGSVGLRAIHARQGLVIVQDPAEAAHDGMPRAAIATGNVDRVLPASEIAAAIVAFAGTTGSATEIVADGMPAIIDLLRTTTAHDFSAYKPGTLRRRTRQRMATLGVESDAAYLDLLRDDADERDRLAKGLLINVTRFFRDPEVFALLADTGLPMLLDRHDHAQPMRLWVAGCSTGEETYSLAMIFSERIAASGQDIRLQVFASDVDPDAVARARTGVYPDAIEADVSAERLARFFTRVDEGWRVNPDLRASVVFTIQDLLADPPFSRLDFVSCRNVLIYLDAEAQARVVSQFHFALREGGLLLLGSAEIVPPQDARFAVVSKAARLYRHVGRRRPGDLRLATEDRRSQLPAVDRVEVSRPSALADLARRLVLQRHAPAAVLINRRMECLFTLGPIDRYLRIGPGAVTSDVLAMARHGIRAKLRVVVQAAVDTGRWAIVEGARVIDGAQANSFRIEVEPTRHAGEDLLLICFVASADSEAGAPAAGPDLPGAELLSVRDELARALRELEISAEDQRVAQEEALSISEEYQSTNEELLTSKEELQSLNEELTALNSQLQETLEKQRTTADDLQNVLYSTDVATLFLDRDLNIRLFTPTTRAVFRLIASDVGRPLADLASLTGGGALADDARAVLADSVPVEREIEAADGVWFDRRVLPYRASGGSVEGVVITFTDVTERKAAEGAVNTARHQAERANAAKSRFLAAASHDLRQPLQALTLTQGLLAAVVGKTTPAPLVARLAGTIGRMSDMLDSLLDINQIEAGVIEPVEGDFPVADLLVLAGEEFETLAGARGLRLRCLPTPHWTHSDPALLMQMLRNLVANAIKYTRSGGVLVGCRRRGAGLSLEVWDTGIGIADDKLGLIFEEFRQLDGASREPHLGMGLGLAIVDRLAVLLGHGVRVSSRPGRGSMFAIDLPLREAGVPESSSTATPVSSAVPLKGTILVAEDEPDLRELLSQFLIEAGHSVIAAASGEAAIEAVSHAAFPPDLLIVDYNLPDGLTGLQVVARLRAVYGSALAAAVLTGDICTDTLRAVALADCVHLAKPVRLAELTGTVQTLLAHSAGARVPSVPHAKSGLTAHLVDDDPKVLTAIRDALETEGHHVETYASSEAFLAAAPHAPGCLLLDAHLPGMSGLALLEQSREAGSGLPTVMITGRWDVAMAVAAMRAGAIDFVRKPVARGELVAAIERAMGWVTRPVEQHEDRNAAIAHLSGLTARQREVMDMVLAGHPNKNIAIDLGISQRTVENHRASIMSRTGSHSLPDLVRTAMTATR